jgi:hypothetical protein
MFVSEELGGTGQVPEPDTGAAAPAVSTSASSSPESMMMIGSAVILGGWLLFGIILDDYFTDWTALLLAVLVLALTMSRGGFLEGLASKNTLLKIGGYAIGVLAVFELIFDLRFASGVLNDFVEILGALALFGGSALVFMGARALDD